MGLSNSSPGHVMVNAALVLEGGGLRGNYTAGVLQAFFSQGLVFPYVIGVSAGAGYGSSFVAGQPGRNLEILKRFHGDKRYLSVRNLLFTGSIFGMDFVFHEIPDRHIPFDFEALISSPARFTSVCTDCVTGQACYFEKYDGMKRDDFLTTLEASSSMPYVSRIVRISGIRDDSGKVWSDGRFLDGAIADAIPLKKAVSEGFAKNVVVLTNPAGYRKKQEFHPPDAVFYPRFPLLRGALHSRVERYNAVLEHVEAGEKAGRVLVVRPGKNLGVSRVEKSTEKLLELYQLGLEEGEKACEAIRLL